jgi:flavorubredoxin
MEKRKITDGVYALGAIDWNRQLFDALIPLPDGTSYNSYLVKGQDKTALLDTVDPAKSETLMQQLNDVGKIDYIVSHHSEQDHSGTIPLVLDKYPTAKVLASDKAKNMLIDLLPIDADKIVVIKDGDKIDLGNKTLEVISTPWVHWPETISTYLVEDNILFSCDFFGSHYASTELFADNDPFVNMAAKRYYAEIMMPFRKVIRKNLDKIKSRVIAMIAPSHGPIYRRSESIINAYEEWGSDSVKNEVVVPYISMHGSTEKMVEYLTGQLAQQGIKVHLFDLSTTDLGKLAIALVDAASIVVATPTVLVGPHPSVLGTVHLVKALRPKFRFASIIGSYGWSSKVVEQISSIIDSPGLEIIDPVICKGSPGEETFDSLDRLAWSIAQKHKDII